MNKNQNNQLFVVSFYCTFCLETKSTNPPAGGQENIYRTFAQATP